MSHNGACEHAAVGYDLQVDWMTRAERGCVPPHKSLF